jgi:membrane protease YdiL (CAAX protease family)
MTTITAFIKRHPVLSYFIITFAISWGGVYILGAPYGMPTTSEQFAKVWPIVFIPYFLGPSMAGLLLTGIVQGRAGFRELLSRMLKWRVSLRWYAVALLTAPLVVTPILLLLSLTSLVFLPDILTTASKVSLIVSGLLIGLIFGGILEELGWTGFAIPGLRRNYSVLTTGLIVGVLWGVWHLFPGFWGSGDASGVFSPLLFFPPSLFFMGVLPPYRVLMAWVFDRTGSQFVIMFMHMSITASTLFILAPAARGVQLMIYYVILTAMMWIVALAVVRR